jgi:hypothetical protein
VGVLPYTTVGLDKVGTCGLCGATGPLTQAHVPPRCAGNDGEARPLVIQKDENGNIELAAGRARSGGARAYLLCGDCNGRVGTWDRWFCDFWHSLMNSMAPYWGQSSSASVLIELERGHPGAIIRSILGGMFAINRRLREQWPDVAGAILSGNAQAPPSDMQLWLDIYLGARGYISGGGSRVDVQTGLASYVDGEMTWPPLHMILSRQGEAAASVGATDISGWLTDAGDVVRRVNLQFQVIDDSGLWASGLGF